MQVTFNDQVYECDSALRGADYVQLFTSGEPTVSFYGIVDFSAFQLSGGEWTYPYVTLPATGWQGEAAPYTQTISYPGVTSTNDFIVAPLIETADDLNNQANAQIQATAQGLGTITFSAFGYKPESDLKFNVRVLF